MGSWSKKNNNKCSCLKNNNNNNNNNSNNNICDVSPSLPDEMSAQLSSALPNPTTSVTSRVWHETKLYFYQYQFQPTNNIEFNTIFGNQNSFWFLLRKFDLSNLCSWLNRNITDLFSLIISSFMVKRLANSYFLLRKH